jgi:hypothetical protein
MTLLTTNTKLELQPNTLLEDVCNFEIKNNNIIVKLKNMKKIFFFILIVCHINIAAQQSFAPVGTEWYYGETIYPMFSNSEIKTYDYNLLKSVRDTTINSKVCNTITRTKGIRLCISTNSALVYQSNDTVYLYDSILNNFCPLYVFGANKGDSWMVFNVQVIVDSVSTIQALGRTLRMQYVTYKTLIDNIPPYPITYTSRIIEGIGDVEDFFRFNIHETTTCDESGIVHTGLRCYIHPDLGTYNTGINSCDYVTSIPELDETSKLKTFKLLDDFLCIESLDNAIFSIRLLDMRGQTMYEKQNVDKQKIEIPILSSGIMICVITLQSGRIIIRKI